MNCQFSFRHGPPIDVLPVDYNGREPAPEVASGTPAIGAVGRSHAAAPPLMGAGELTQIETLPQYTEAFDLCDSVYTRASGV